MPAVRHSGPNNSTHFTTCCEVAILDHQGLCPMCSKAIYPEDDEGNLRYTGNQRRIMRSDWCNRGLRR